MTTPRSPWDRLYNDCKIAIPGVIDAVFAQETFRVVKDFCDYTNGWTEDVPITVQPSTFDYPFEFEGYGIPKRLMLLYDPSLTPPNVKKWVSNSPSMPVPGTIHLNYSPSQQATWIATVSKLPSDPADGEGYPQIDFTSLWLLDMFRDCLYAGILSRLKREPGKPYSDPAGSRTDWREYVSLRSKARVDLLKMNTFGGQNWQYPQEFATVTRKGWA